MPEFFAKKGPRGDSKKGQRRSRESGYVFVPRVGNVPRASLPAHEADKYSEPGIWKPGQSGNPAGRVRQKLSQKFIRDLASDYEKHGKSTIIRVRRYDPVAYMGLVLKSLPTDQQSEDVRTTLTPQQCKEELAKLMDELGYERKVAGDIISEQ